MTFSKKLYSNIYLRIFVILLCCVFVFQLFSVKAHAAISAVTAAAISVIASILIGIGVSAMQDLGESTGTFNDLALAIENALKPPDVVSDWIVELYQSDGKLFAPASLVEDVKYYLTSHGIVWTTGAPMVGERVSFYFGDNSWDFATPSGSPVYAVCGHTLNNSSFYPYTYSIYIASTDEDFIRYDSEGNVIGNYTAEQSVDGVYYRLLYYNAKERPAVTTSLPIVYFGEEGYNPMTIEDYISLVARDVSVYTDLDLDVSGVPNYNLNPDYTFEEYYPAWTPLLDENSNTIGYTIVVGDTIDDILGFTQSQVQAGAGSIVVPDTGEGTIAQWLENIWTGIQALPQSIATSITDSLSSKIEPEQLELNLTEFFPFCIPFDIYEFFAILAADPVAPVFEWTIPVPQLGTSYDFEIDLSVWDPVAQLFRTMELLAFCVGLAFFTRDKFTRG